MLPADLPDDVIGDARAFAQLGQVQLGYLAALADVVHQVEGVAFFTQKCHSFTRNSTSPVKRARSVGWVHYTVNRPLAILKVRDS